MTRTMYRGAALVVTTLWIYALLLPAAEVRHFGELFHFTSAELLNPDGFHGGLGLMLLELGWLGPIEYSPAWYANIPLTVCVILMAFGRPPGKRLSLIGLTVAFTVFLPYWQISFSDDRGGHLAWEGGPAVWAWLAAFTVTTTASFMPGFPGDQPSELRKGDRRR